MACTSGMAQSGMTYSMTPISFISKNGTAIGGESVVVDGKGKCLSVSTGLRALQVVANNKGAFAASCVEVPPVATVLMELTSIKVFPNPTHNTSILKCEGQFDVNLSCQVRVIGMDGRMMMAQMVSMKDVKAGYVINAAAYPAGTYVVSVDFMNQHYTLKLIKL
jgi:hypothetical protein